ncbi:hypothetical protein [uncultured Clostridium sp.]|uniref:hypothetical protein n=1 Tax=uncultured Clostridium sp. TaxID=59620 RepID=UPI00260D2669|nr:hypothetical protein [uncultured Clostridium sp.]
MVKKLVLAGTLVLAIGLGFTGCDVEFGKMDYKDYVEEVVSDDYEENSWSQIKNEAGIIQVNESIENIDDINIDLAIGLVNIQEGNEDKVQVLVNGEKDKIVSNLKNKKLDIKSKGKSVISVKGKNNIAVPEVQISIPKNFNKNINVKVGVGGVGLDCSNIKNLDINVGTGAILNNRAMNIEKLNTNMGIGIVDILINEASNVNIDQEIGGIFLTLKEMNGDITVENKMGSVDIAYLNGKPYVKSEVKVGEKNMTRVEGNGKGSIHGKVNVGELNINKTSIEKIQARNSMDFFEEIMGEVKEMIAEDGN